MERAKGVGRIVWHKYGMSYVCTCCEVSKTYTEQRNLRKHQRKYDPSFILGGQNEVYRYVREKLYSENPRACLQCGVYIPYENICKHNGRIFCSKSCSATHHNRRRPTASKGDAIRSVCLGCERPLNKKNRSYCSHACKSANEQRKYIELWIKGEVNGSDANGSLSRRIRKHLLEEAQLKCSKCGWGEINPKTGMVPLHVDHINGDSTDHAKSNLQVLCPNCHSLTPNFGALNIGRGREQRRLYRQEQRKLGRQVA